MVANPISRFEKVVQAVSQPHIYISLISYLDYLRSTDILNSKKTIVSSVVNNLMSSVIAIHANWCLEQPNSPSRRTNLPAFWSFFHLFFNSNDMFLPHQRLIPWTSTSALSSLSFGQNEDFHKFSLPLFHQLSFPI